MNWQTNQTTATKDLQIGVPVLIEDRDGLYFAGRFVRSKQSTLITFQTTDGAWTFGLNEFAAYAYIPERQR